MACHHIVPYIKPMNSYKAVSYFIRCIVGTSKCIYIRLYISNCTLIRQNIARLIIIPQYCLIIILVIFPTLKDLKCLINTHSQC